MVEGRRDMPDVRLTSKEEEGALPAVCMCCGAPATFWAQRTFLLQDPAVRGPSVFAEIYLVRLLLATAKTPRFRLRTSFCEQHRHYWNMRFALVFGGLAGLFAVLFGGLAVVVFLLAVAKVDAPWPSACVIVPVILYVLAWVLPMKLVMGKSIRARLTEDDRIAVQNVDERYIAAIKAQRQQPGAPVAAVTSSPPGLAGPRPPPGALTDDRPPPRAVRGSAGPNLVLWLALGGVGLVALCACGVPLLSVGFFMAPRTAKTKLETALIPKEGSPNDPDPKEGPPPKGWTVLFRSDDPAVWNTDSPGERFAIPVRRAHSRIRYLRLKRVDTGEVVILAITHRQLALNDMPNPIAGHWWNGTAREGWGARHLGIVQTPGRPTSEHEIVGLVVTAEHIYVGSGFGWESYVNDRQRYCWRGKEIPRTAFEIAVTADALTPAEQRNLVK